MSDLRLDKATLVRSTRLLGSKFGRYSLAMFIIFVGLVYGFVMLRITALSSAEPTAEAVTSQVKSAKTPYIDQAVVKQLQTLQDNSVSVQTIFNDARNNPFTGN